MCEGYIGELSRLLNFAAIDAINTNTECITYDILSRLDWNAPNDRKRQLDNTL